MSDVPSSIVLPAPEVSVPGAPNLDSLPAETIVVHILPYLTNAEAAALAKTCGRLYRVLRHERLYHLWLLYNRKYIEDAAFREEVKAWIPVGRLVLNGSVHFHETKPLITDPNDLVPFVGVHTAELSEIGIRTDISFLAGVHTVLVKTLRGGGMLPGTMHVTVQEAWNADLTPLIGVQSIDIAKFQLPLPAICPQHVVLREAEISDVSMFASARSVSLIDCPNVSFASIAMLRGVVSIRWLDRDSIHAHRDLERIPPQLGNLRTLHMCGSKIRDVTSARGLHTLSLESCHLIEDLLPLANVHTLDLSGFRMNFENWFVRSPRNVACLARVHTLRLSASVPLEGVGSLGDNHTLILSQIRLVHELSSLAFLGRVHSLDLSENYWVTDVTGLSDVHTLNLSRCGRLIDVSPLSRVHTLFLRGCHGVRDVSRLGGIHTLDLSECLGLGDISALAGVHTLSLQKCVQIKDVSALTNVHDLNLSGMELTNVSGLLNVYKLDLSRNSKFEDASSLGNVHTLSLAYCPKLSEVSALGSVHTLDLQRCSRILDVSALNSVYSLNLSGCNGITDVSALKDVTILNLAACSSSLDLSALQHVKKLVLTSKRPWLFL